MPIPSIAKTSSQRMSTPTAPVHAPRDTRPQASVPLAVAPHRRHATTYAPVALRHLGRGAGQNANHKSSTALCTPPASASTSPATPHHPRGAKQVLPAPLPKPATADAPTGLLKHRDLDVNDALRRTRVPVERRTARRPAPHPPPPARRAGASRWRRGPRRWMWHCRRGRAATWCRRSAPAPTRSHGPPSSPAHRCCTDGRRTPWHLPSPWHAATPLGATTSCTAAGTSGLRRPHKLRRPPGPGGPHCLWPLVARGGLAT